ncbi:MAG: hypothetical protein V3S55_14830, partial [Nitrospiraceae bacterium]
MLVQEGGQPELVEGGFSEGIVHMPGLSTADGTPRPLNVSLYEPIDVKAVFLTVAWWFLPLPQLVCVERGPAMMTMSRA